MGIISGKCTYRDNAKAAIGGIEQTRPAAGCNKQTPNVAWSWQS